MADGQTANNRGIALTDITDGTSNTFLVGEKHAPLSKWGQSGPSFGDAVDDCELFGLLGPTDPGARSRMNY